jgi:5-formyltetrahydrofolate cyclo-ligase
MHSSKNYLRSKLKKIRHIAFESHKSAGDALVQFATFFDVKDYSVAAYMPIGTEIDPLPLMKALFQKGARLCLPALRPRHEGFEMVFCAYSFGDTLGVGPMGILQPFISDDLILPDVLLVPLLGYDGNFNRLGYGGGYYDRALGFLRGQKKTMAVGIAFGEQSIEALPTDIYDQKLDAILTPEGLKYR